MQPECAVIPAGGKGTRLRPLTYAVPKELLPLGAMPTIQHVVNDITAAYINTVIVVTGPGKRAIEDHLDAMRRHNDTDAAFVYVGQKEQLGLGDAVRAAAPAVGNRAFIVALGDGVISGSQPGCLLNRMSAAFDHLEADAVVAVESIAPEDTVKYGIVCPGKHIGEVVQLEGLVEKPRPQDAPSNFAICGRYVFSPIIFEYLARLQPGVGGEIQLTDALSALARNRGRVYACPLQHGEHRLDVGSITTYYDAVADMAGFSQPPA